ncbi:phosphoglycerate mutase-like protein [Plenodomus tracheiphilus IPT5]|uniref:Phosphoglycerate mutase-like protein n=1 Tax=Plenodomus tracheiphilus IPT5 TaxID=1408161 RepID=A0A6A7ARP9_9PLEO|nr:phosphoglycerate mutase-like protein [Plenodomus tracheiphilus IPT5]
MPPLIHIIRHGEGMHNIQRDHPSPDPPLTHRGQGATKNIHIPFTPDLIVISPMTRTIQTAMNIFPSIQDPNRTTEPVIPVQIWPDLRETYEALCNRGVSRSAMQTAFPQFDFSECHEDWDYAEHSIEAATARAESVRARLKMLSKRFENIVVVTHRGFAEYLVKGKRFGLCERRAYRFATEEEAREETVRMGMHCERDERMDFGPTVLVREGVELRASGEDAVS